MRITEGQVEAAIGPHAHTVKTLMDVPNRIPPYKPLEGHLARVGNHLWQPIQRGDRQHIEIITGNL